MRIYIRGLKRMQVTGATGTTSLLLEQASQILRMSCILTLNVFLCLLQGSACTGHQ